MHVIHPFFVHARRPLHCATTTYHTTHVKIYSVRVDYDFTRRTTSSCPFRSGCGTMILQFFPAPTRLFPLLVTNRKKNLPQIIWEGIEKEDECGNNLLCIAGTLLLQYISGIKGRREELLFGTSLSSCQGNFAILPITWCACEPLEYE